ncbi:MAG: heme exporter protein CcmB [Pseudomonadota bacterium]
MSLAKAGTALLLRDLRLSLHAGGGGGTALMFFLAIVVVMPFAIGPDLNLLSRLAPAILWTGALLASLLTLERLFQADAEDGTLDLIRMGPLPLEAVVAIKALVHWLTTGLPLSLAAPFLGLLLAIPGEASLAVMATLLVGTPALSLLGTVGAALTVGLRRGGVLLAILVLPLCVPVLIFGVGASNAATLAGGNVRAPLMLLGALSLATAALAPFAGAAALRAGLGD